ncbi:MAG: cell division protein SepF [Lachnospiraceae bacterium]|nr:cell division protein SepF [Lachnospiraceae bacterium]
MSVMDRLINAMKINPDEDYDDYGFDEMEQEDSAPKLFSRRKEEPAYDEPAERERPKAAASYGGFRSSRRSIVDPTAGMEVCVIKPTSVEEARELTDTLLANRTVVLNLEGLDVDIAQRIIDFTSGSCYAIHGNLMKISHYIFVVTPESVDISGDITASMGIEEQSGGMGGFQSPFAP